jgi:DNA-binding NarL/FixJ family response regulator
MKSTSPNMVNSVDVTQTETEQENRTFPDKTLRVVVADDHPGFLKHLVSLLEAEFLVVATAQNGQVALERVTQSRPDVVVLDLEMPGLDGLATARELKNMPLPPAVVIYSLQNDLQIVEVARQAGAMGYVFKTCINQDLTDAVKSAARGEFFVSSHCERPVSEMEDTLVPV